jgi:hypothetical protein
MIKKNKTYNEPAFWENLISEEPIIDSLIDNFSQIKSEALRAYKYANFLYDNYPASNLNKKIKWYFIEPGNDWKIAPFFGGRYDVNANKKATKIKLLISDLTAFFVRLICPKTYLLLKNGFRSKKILNAYFAKLGPGSQIKPHIHPITNGICRMNIHLGIFCDPSATITVGEETKTWENGKILAFKNSGPYRHSVVHNGTKDRIILIVELDVKYLQKYGVFNEL